MKERPILFSTAMVQAILDGRKTMTRRAVKCKLHECFNGFANTPKEVFNCPYGQPGDILWVREKFTPDRGGYFYAADNHLTQILNWKPSIHMPKAAARIWLQVEAVRVERLQDITEADAEGEGAKTVFCQYVNDTQGYHSYVEGFRKIWQSINGPESWEQNPWVWVVSFKVLSTTGRPDFL